MFNKVLTNKLNYRARRLNSQFVLQSKGMVPFDRAQGKLAHHDNILNQILKQVQDDAGTGGIRRKGSLHPRHRRGVEMTFVCMSCYMLHVSCLVKSASPRRYFTRVDTKCIEDDDDVDDFLHKRSVDRANESKNCKDHEKNA